MTEFTPFPKIARLSRECVITEKLDGTNASVCITYREDPILDAVAFNDGMYIYAGSRTRWLDTTSKGDNFGFAKWVEANAEELLKLGLGHHFGEWWGHGIQRGYGLTEKRFSLFNTHRWGDDAVRPACCHVVPVLYQGVFDTSLVDEYVRWLADKGSKAAPGYMKPEGIVVYHTAANQLFKKTIEKDAEPKGKQA